jgi:hypothetical protein
MKRSVLVAALVCAAVSAAACSSDKQAVRGVSAPGTGGTPTPSWRPELNPNKGSDNGPR